MQASAVERLPDELLDMVFAHLTDGCDLAMAGAVCRRWRARLLAHGEAPWLRLCRRYRLLDDYSTEQRTAQRAQQYAARRVTAKAPRRLAYRELYAKLRVRVCRVCAEVKRQNMWYPLGDTYMCLKCRQTCYPLVCISKSEAKRAFRWLDYDSLLTSGKPVMDVSYGSTSGHILLLRDVEDLAGGLADPRVAQASAAWRAAHNVRTIDPATDLLRL